METVCQAVPLPQMANMVEQGETPILPPARLEALGYRLAAYPLTLLSAAIRAMEQALAEMAAGRHPEALLKDFAALREVVGFEDYYAAEERYKDA
jgi:2-methylisocitrate lyase-like PEP mutase family enzyme